MCFVGIQTQIANKRTSAGRKTEASGQQIPLKKQFSQGHLLFPQRHFCLPRICRNMWRHFWLSQVGKGMYATSSRQRTWVLLKTYRAGQPSTRKKIQAPSVNGSRAEKASFKKRGRSLRCQWTWAYLKHSLGRKEGGGFRKGNTCIPVADSF